MYPAATNGTIERSLALLRRAFSLGKAAKKISSVPVIKRLKVSNVRKGFFEADQYRAVLAHVPDYVRPIVVFGYYTGCRRGEILGLRWNQVDLAESVVRLEPGETKNDEGRTIPLARELRAVLTKQKELRDELFPKCTWVFFRLGEPVRDFRRAWVSACKKAGLIDGKGSPDRLFHDLRRTGVRNLIRAGVPERVAMKISGHKTRSMLDRYNIVSEADLKDAAKKLGDYLGRDER